MPSGFISNPETILKWGGRVSRSYEILRCNARWIYYRNKRTENPPQTGVQSRVIYPCLSSMQRRLELELLPSTVPRVQTKPENPRQGSSLDPPYLLSMGGVRRSFSLVDDWNVKLKWISAKGDRVDRGVDLSTPPRNSAQRLRFGTHSTPHTMHSASSVPVLTGSGTADTAPCRKCIPNDGEPPFIKRR